MAATGADPVTAIANAAGSLFSTVGSFVNKAAQRYGLQKGMEASAVDFEHQKTLTAYNAVASGRQTIVYFILGLTVIIVLLIAIKQRN